MKKDDLPKWIISSILATFYLVSNLLETKYRYIYYMILAGQGLMYMYGPRSNA